MGWSPSQVQLPVGVPERMGQHHGRHAELITTHLSLEAIQSILDGVTLGATHRAEGYDPAMVKGDNCLEKEVCVTPG